MRLRGFLLVCLLALAGILPAHAGIADAPGEDLEVSLVTYGPGETYWERFGHDAIELRDRASGQAYNFNYGVFDFDESGFLLNFARGRMHYMMDAAPTADDEAFYREAGRSITRQTLALTPAQAASLRDFLLWNLQPQHRRYDYDYYVDNCTTRVRDALDRALGGQLRMQFRGHPGGMTYRQQTDRLMSAQPWLMLLLDFGLGPYADQPLDAWHESFLPDVLAREVARVRVGPATDSRPLVSAVELIAPNRVAAPPATPPDLRAPLAAAGLAFGTLLVLMRVFSRAGFALLASLYLLLAGLAGTGLAILWLLTSHQAAWANANLLAFNPMAFLLLPATWAVVHGRRAARWAEGLLALQLLALLAALALHLSSGRVQQNLPWLLFALPCWLALAWSVRASGWPAIRLTRHSGRQAVG